jgi:hypothetical protein
MDYQGSKPQSDMMHMMRIMTGSLQHMIEWKQKRGRQEILQCMRESTYPPVGTPPPPPPRAGTNQSNRCRRGAAPALPPPPPTLPPPHSQRSPYRLNFLSFNEKKVLYNRYNTCLQYSPTVLANFILIHNIMRWKTT